VSLNLARQLSTRLGAAATALGDPLFRYRSPTQPNTVTLRRRPTVDIPSADVEEVESDEMTLDGPIESGLPPLPDDEIGVDVGVMDT
ncbi:MAG: hypothetical protein QF464_15265, partial [Myxococcota bacterium]|nr:hypothetical protein [Myxococcota bacterium]